MVTEPSQSWAEAKLVTLRAGMPRARSTVTDHGHSEEHCGRADSNNNNLATSDQGKQTGQLHTSLPLPIVQTHYPKGRSCKRRKRENRLTGRANAQTIHILHTGLLHSHLPHAINHCEYSELFHATFQHNDCTSASFPSDPVTLSEYQGHSNWIQTVEFSSV